MWPQIGLPASDEVSEGLEREGDPRLYSGPPEADEKGGIAGQRAGTSVEKCLCPQMECSDGHSTNMDADIFTRLPRSWLSLGVIQKSSDFMEKEESSFIPMVWASHR